jgi:hypothetical protein
MRRPGRAHHAPGTLGAPGTHLENQPDIARTLILVATWFEKVGFLGFPAGFVMVGLWFQLFSVENIIVNFENQLF